METSAPIGVFDSGIGGLTVVKQMMKILPKENIIYFGDTARVPYGSRPPAQIVHFTHEILNMFAAQKIKLAVFACNTMTALGLEIARKKYPFPMVATSTGAKTAVTLTKNKRIGVLATQGTVAGGKHAKQIGKLDPCISVYPQPCPKFVPLVETGQVDGYGVEKAASEYLWPLREQGVDTIILGCTHYPYLAPVLEHLMGERVKLVDPAVETAQEAKRCLAKNKLTATSGQGSVRYLFSSDPERAHELARLIMGDDLPEFELIKLEDYQP